MYFVVLGVALVLLKLLEVGPLADNTTEIPSDAAPQVWTDDFNNLFRAMKIGLLARKTVHLARCDKSEPEDQPACRKKNKERQR